MRLSVITERRREAAKPLEDAIRVSVKDARDTRRENQGFESLRAHQISQSRAPQAIAGLFFPPVTCGARTRRQYERGWENMGGVTGVE